jgi:cytochrome c553
MDVEMILKQNENKNKTIRYGLMGVCSNCHGHENNQI